MTQEDEDKDEPVTLAPLDPETALRALLAVKPDDDAPKDKPKGKRRKKSG